MLVSQKLRAVVIVVLAAVVSGCATVGVAGGGESAVQPAKLLAGYRHAGEVQVLMSRVSRVTGAACDVRLYANGLPVADVGSGESVAFGVAAGPLNLRAHFAERGICPGQVSTLRLVADKGQQVRLVYDVSHMGQHVFQALD